MKNYKVIKKCSIEELCTSRAMGIPCDRWCTDEECIQYTAELIMLGVLSLDMMKDLLIKEDYWKVHKAYKTMQKQQ